MNNDNIEIISSIHQMLMYFHKNGLITTEQFLDVLGNCIIINAIPKAIEYAKGNIKSKKEEHYVSFPVDVDLARRIDELRLRGLAKCQDEEGWAELGKEMQNEKS